MGATYQDVPSIILPNGSGGTGEFFAMNDPLAWMGTNPVHVGQFYAADYTLNDTDWKTWTPSTTAADIKASVNANTFTANLADYEYYLRWSFDFVPAFKSGATMKLQTYRQFGNQWQSIHKRPYGLTRFSSKTDYYNYCNTMVSASIYLLYYDSNGAQTWTTTASYGVYPTLTAATFSSSSNDTTTVTPKAPKLSARRHKTYMTATRAAEIDGANSTVRIRGDLYRVDKGLEALRNCYRMALDYYDNPIPAIPTNN